MRLKGGAPGYYRVWPPYLRSSDGVGTFRSRTLLGIFDDLHYENTIMKVKLLLKRMMLLT
ncbi:unnamed protein product [Musa banksii]